MGWADDAFSKRFESSEKTSGFIDSKVKFLSIKLNDIKSPELCFRELDLS